VVEEQTITNAAASIEAELDVRHQELMLQGHLVEAQRLLSRTRYDLEMLREVGTCPGIENYSRHLTGRKAGERPYCLYDFFPPDFLCIIDESHVTIPQIGAMYAGDRSRKEALVQHGFRLPSALDNRPLKFSEWEQQVKQAIFVSATPGPWEAQHESARTEQLIRPTGVPDPTVHVRQTTGQVEDLIREVKIRCARNERTLITTVTKRLAEDLSEYLTEAGVRTAWLHSDIDAIERMEILHALRIGESEALVGVNLLREGLDLPEVSLVVILDADKEGFLRSPTSLIQTIGRAARHLTGEVILYADGESPAMRYALAETDRRRKYQQQWNTDHGIIPTTAMRQDTGNAFAAQIAASRAAEVGPGPQVTYNAVDVPDLTRRMIAAAEELRFEEAARLRDQIRQIESGGTATAEAEGDEPVKAKKMGRGRGRRRR